MPCKAGSSTNAEGIGFGSEASLAFLFCPVLSSLLFNCTRPPAPSPCMVRWDTREHLARLFSPRAVCCTFLFPPFPPLTRLFLSPNQQVDSPASFPRAFYISL